MFSRIATSLLIAASMSLLGCGGDDDDPGTGPPLPATQIALFSGDGQTGVTGTALVAPFIVRVRDAQGGAVSGEDVTWAVTAGGGSVSAASTQTNSQGQASVILTLGPAAGANTVTASAAGLTGSPVTFNATATAPPTPSEILLVSGDNQNGKTLEQLSSPFVVQVVDQEEVGVSGVTVTWEVTGDGSLSTASTETDAQGQASVSLTLGAALGDNTVTAVVAGLTGSPVTFNARTTVLVIEMVGTAFVDPNGGTNGNSVAMVAVGDTIEWVNRDAIQHTATSNAVPAGGAAFDSGLLGTGDTFRFVPDVAGTWEYLCQVHPLIMQGATITAQ